MTKHPGSTLIRACLALALGSLDMSTAEAAYVVSTFDVPGAANTIVFGINGSGAVAGTTFGSGPTALASGFVYRQGLLQTLSGPSGAIETAALGLANTGTVVGYWLDSTSTHTATDYDDQGNPIVITVNTQRGFIWKDGTYATINAPYAGVLDTSLRAISPDGRYVLGSYFDASQGATPFVLDTRDGSYTRYPALWGKAVGGINSTGHMVVDSFTAQATIIDLGGSTLSTFGLSGARRVSPRGINDLDQLAGRYISSANGAPNLWIGTAASYSVLTLPALANTGYLASLNNLGQAAGSWYAADGTQHGLIATRVLDPVPLGGPAGTYQFSTAVQADVPIFIDPIVAIGYVYKVGSGDPLFKTISLPIGIGDNHYFITVDGQTFSVAGNEIFDLTAHGFASGAGEFTVTGIEPEALLDPANSNAFVTRLTFMADGMFTGTQTALTLDYAAPVPEPQSWALLSVGLTMLARQRRPPAQAAA